MSRCERRPSAELHHAALEADDPARRAEACDELAESADPQAFWLLARSLRHDTGLVRGRFLPIPVRAYAAQALGKLGDSRAVDHLCRALMDRGDDRFWDAVQAQPLGDLVSYDDVNTMAAEALGSIADPAAIAPLSRAARCHPSPVVRSAAARSIGAILARRPDAGASSEVRALARRSGQLDRERLEAALAALASFEPDLARLLREESE